jgi:hypothetical protein
MRLRSLLILCVGLALAGCVEWPDVPEPEGVVTSGAWPTLLPMADLKASPVVTDADLAAFETMEVRAARLRQRAALLRSPVTDQDSFDRLRNRLSQ